MNFLFATPSRRSRGLCIFQKWAVDFDPSTLRLKVGSSSKLPTTMKIPTWVTLKQILEEFQTVSIQIAENIRELINMDTSND